MHVIQLLTKAGQMVDELARSGSLTPAELAKAVSEPRPSVYRIASALEGLGIVRASEGGRLELGPRLLRWGDAAVAAFVDRVELSKQLRGVKEQLGMNAYFCVPGASGLLCLDHVAGSDVDMLALEPGRTLPPRSGAASLVAVAFRPPGHRDETVPGWEPEQVERVVARGWAVDDGEMVPGAASVAVPVRIHDVVVGVIGVAGLRASVLPRTEAAAEVLAAAAGIMAKSMNHHSEAGHVAPGSELATERTGTRAPVLILKAGALMEALAAERIATSGRLTELIDEPASSVYRMLVTLAEMGWVEQISPRGAYRIGGRLLTLSAEVSRRLDLRRAARPILRQIHEATGETTFLCVRHGTRAVCIERIDGLRVNGRVLRLGGSLPLHLGAAPQALLAFEERDAWDDYASHAEMSEDLRRNVGSRSELFAQLEGIRAAGVSVSDNNVTPGIAAIGAPIFDHNGQVAASLSVSGLREEVLSGTSLGQKSVRDLVLWGAQELSRYLGWDARDPSEDDARDATDAPVLL